MAFITNEEKKDLKRRLAILLKVSNKMKFLVGFFYFSGLRELYRELKSKREKNIDFALNILVGLSIDKTQFGLIEVAEQGSFSNKEISEKYFNSIIKALNYKDFDNKEFYEQAHFFINLMQSGKLNIRKTIMPNHAKLYIFTFDQTQIAKDKLFITGSSNLTKAGLLSQYEFNVEISDYGLEEAETYFDDLWEVSVKITEDNLLRSRLVKILNENTLIKQVTPFEAYVWVIKNYLKYFETQMEEKSLSFLLKSAGYSPYKYQIDAINQSLSIIKKHGGVIIADVVGLGKSVIASAAARSYGARGIVICPPSIIGDRKLKDSGWWGYLEDFGLTNIGWEVWSLGDLEKLNQYIKNNQDIKVIIIDEAHRFRNEDTKSYEFLKNISRGRKVMLLTATPFNNRPSDILSLLKLFIVPKKSTISLEDDLLTRFSTFKTTFDRLGYISKYHNSVNSKKRNKAKNYFKMLFGSENIDLSKVKTRVNYLAKEIRSVMEPITIRRNRLDLTKNPRYKEEVKNLSRVADPIEWFFELTKKQSVFYNKILSFFLDPESGGRFKGAMYRPFEYERSLKDKEKLPGKESFEYISQKNLYDIMRRLLVKRFESSFGAFKQSIENFKKLTNIVLQFVERTDKFILDRKLIEEIYEMDMDEIEERLKEYETILRENQYPKYNKVYQVDKFERKDEFIKALKDDLKMFKDILNELDELDLESNDPKFKELVEEVWEIRKKDPKRKIIIFSEYTDTVKYLEKNLKKYYKDRILIAYGALSRSKLNEIIENFDASLDESKQKDEYDILISTDKLSEGVNLNRAGMVINYDIPWNPVRVIQRVGRINRISKKVFDNLYIVNFFPTERGANIVKSREIAAQKMFMIHKVLGEDARIFDIDEEPQPSELYIRINKNPEALEEESFYTKMVNEFENIKKKYPEIVEKVQRLPQRIKVSKKGNEDSLLVFFKKFERIYALRKSLENNNVEAIQIENAVQSIRCDINEESLEWNTDKFWKSYEKILEYREVSRKYAEQSLSKKALNVIKTLLNNFKNSKTFPEKSRKFLIALKEDILDYGTLADYTLRRITEIGDLDDEKKILESIDYLMDELGENYLELEKRKVLRAEKEVIVAFYNKKEVENELFESEKDN